MEKEGLMKIVLGAVILVVAVIPITITCFNGLFVSGDVTTYTNDDDGGSTYDHSANRGIEITEYAKKKGADSWHVKVGAWCTWYELKKGNSIIETWGNDPAEYGPANIENLAEHDTIEMMFFYNGGDSGGYTYFHNADIYLNNASASAFDIHGADYLDVVSDGRDAILTSYRAGNPQTTATLPELDALYIVKSGGDYMLGDLKSMTYTDEKQLNLVLDDTNSISYGAIIVHDGEITFGNLPDTIEVFDLDIGYTTEELEGGGKRITAIEVSYKYTDTYTAETYTVENTIDSRFNAVMPYTVYTVDGYVTPMSSILLTVIPIVILAGIVFWLIARMKLSGGAE